MIFSGTRRPRLEWRRAVAEPRTGSRAVTSRRARSRVLTVGFSVAAALGMLLTSAALAANWDGPNDGNQGWAVAGGNPVDFTQCDLNATVHDFFHSNNDHDIAPTNINPNGTHACSTIDVGIGDDNFFSGFRGFAECHDFVSPNTCNVAHAHIDLSHPDVPENFFLTLRVVCQEIGHTVGLRHRVSSADSCMWNGAATSAHLDSHDTSVLNSHY